MNVELEITIQNELLTVAEFAKIVKMHPNTIRKMIRKGRIIPFRGGIEKRWAYRIPRSEIDRIMRFDMEQMIERIIEQRKNNDSAIIN